MKKIITFNLILMIVLSTPLSYGQNNQFNQQLIEGDQAGRAIVVNALVAPLADSTNYTAEGLIAYPFYAGVILGGLLIGDLLTDTCISRWHPGDFYYEKNYEIMTTKNKEVWKCYHESKCVNKVDMNVVMGATRPGGGMSFAECRQKCINDVVNSAPDSVAHCAKKKTDGYYSDGSYYYSSAGNQIAQLFKNSHKKRDRYKRNQWQTARDECMDEASMMDSAGFTEVYDAYNNCLKGKGF